jgi:uncharacterized protein (TIGR02217 family)
MPELAAFHDVRFPLDIALGASGGPARRTEIVALASGHEQRNQRWSRSRRRYDAGFAIRTIAQLQEIIAFFEARSGRLHSFRFRDPLDGQSSAHGSHITPLDQQIGTGNGAVTRFQLAKNLTGGPAGSQRVITKPVPGSVRVAVGGTERVAGTHFSVEHLTGMVTFLPGSVPVQGARITAGFAFDIPARFDTDEIRVSLMAFEAGEVPSIPIVEVLE